MRIRNTAILTILLIIFSCTSLLAAVNGVATLSVDAITVLPYDGESEATARINLSVIGDATNTTRPIEFIYIQFSRGSSSTFDPRTMSLNGVALNYNLYDTTNPYGILMNRANGTSWDNFITLDTNGLTGSFVENFSFDIKIPAGQSVLNGTYTDSKKITIKLFGFLGPNAPSHTPFSLATAKKAKLLDSQKRTIKATAAFEFKLSLVARNAAFDFTSSTYNLDFGILDPSESLEADLIIDSHESYSINVTSAQGNKMKHTLVNEYVDYSFSFDGSPITLAAGVSTPLVTSAAASFTPGDRYPIDITVATIIDEPAGDYEDNLTFTITAN